MEEKSIQLQVKIGNGGIQVNYGQRMKNEGWRMEDREWMEDFTQVIEPPEWITRPTSLLAVEGQAVQVKCLQIFFFFF